MFSINKRVILLNSVIVSVIVICIFNLSFNKGSVKLKSMVLSNDTPAPDIVLQNVSCNKNNKTSKWITVGKEDYFIFSVIGEQVMTTSKWKSLVFSGLERSGLSNIKYKCCYKYSDDIIISKISGNKRYKFTNGDYIATQIVCDISVMAPPDSATVVSMDKKCNSDRTYLSPIYRLRDPSPKLAICGKVAYGSKRSQELIEWFEFHLHFGGGPFIIYAYENLNSDAVKVLKYYEGRGVLEIVHVPYVPLLDKYPRMFGRQTPNDEQDDQVMNFDFQQRARHFTSYSMVDTDEFIVPIDRNITSYVQLLTILLKKYPKAGFLTMRTETHLKDWGKTDPSSKLLIGQYEYHTEPRSLTEKSFFLPERIHAGTMWHHDAKTLDGYFRAYIEPTDVVLKHYRYCKERWFRSTEGKIPCLDHFQKFRGHIMETMAKQIESNVFGVIAEIFVNTTVHK